MHGSTYHWNRKIEVAASKSDILRVRVEDISAEMLRELLRIIDADDSAHPDAKLTAELAGVPANVVAKITGTVMLPGEVACPR